MPSILTLLHFLPLIAFAIFGVWLFHWIVTKRVVVPTNLVHIVQSGKKTTSFGAAGIASVRDLFSSKGGQAIGAALEGLKNTETGAAVINTITGGKK